MNTVSIILAIIGGGGITATVGSVLKLVTTITRLETSFLDVKAIITDHENRIRAIESARTMHPAP